MTPENFCYWLQGYFELEPLSGNGIMTDRQIQVVKEHLKLVFAAPKSIPIDWTKISLPTSDKYNPITSSIVEC